MIMLFSLILDPKLSASYELIFIDEPTLKKTYVSKVFSSDEEPVL